MNYDPLITSLAPCDARCPPCPRVGPASLRVTRHRPASRLYWPASRGPQSPANLLLINTNLERDEIGMSCETITLAFAIKIYWQLSDGRTKQRVTRQYQLSAPIKWTLLLWLGQVCSDSGQIRVEQKSRSAEQMSYKTYMWWQAEICQTRIK